VGHTGFNGHSAGLFHLPSLRTTIAVYFNRGFFDDLPVYDGIAEALGCRKAPAP